MARSSSSFTEDDADGNVFSTQGNQPSGPGFQPVVREQLVEKEHARGWQRLPSKLLSTADSDSSSWIARHQGGRSPLERQELATIALKEADG